MVMELGEESAKEKNYDIGYTKKSSILKHNHSMGGIQKKTLLENLVNSDECENKRDIIIIDSKNDLMI
ncbi:TPA: hypothetical protein IU259_001051 [Enterococcus faecalis]|nr:hypothetical protein [Enterococcus faecalis]HAP5732884.1 hypothetical protein [Enterococcus faecalis]